jgi:hypothetical protein
MISAMTALLPPDGGPMTDDHVRILRGALQDGGFSWLPEITAKKFSTFGDWVDRRDTFRPEVSYLGKVGTLLNTALYLNGLYAIDIDVDELRDVEAIWTVMCRIIGEPACVRYRTNSARVAALYRQAVPDGLYRAANGSDGAIEVLCGERAKLTAFGIHQDKITAVRSRLRWCLMPGNVTKADLSEATADQVERFLHAAQDHLGDDTSIRYGRQRDNSTPSSDRLADSFDELYDALQRVSNAGPMHWREWNKIGMALYAATDGGDLGLAAFLEWTRKNPLTAHRDCSRRWNAYATCPPTRLGAGTIFYLAQQNGYRRSPAHDDIFAAMSRHQRRERSASRKALADFRQQEI